jgi:RHS repeat-associated protein
MDSGGIPRENNRVFPFGEPWLAFAGSTNNEKFTTYQHDNDAGTDLDYAMARYYASRSGRFISSDPGHIGADLGDPQSWNGYVYSRNDPVNLIDPTGLWYSYGLYDDDVQIWREASDSEFERLVASGNYGMEATGNWWEGGARGSIVRGGVRIGNYIHHEVDDFTVWSGGVYYPPTAPRTRDPKTPTIGPVKPSVEGCAVQGVIDGLLDLFNIDWVPGASLDKWEWNPDTFSFDYVDTPRRPVATFSNAVDVTQYSGNVLTNFPMANRNARNFLNSIGIKVPHKKFVDGARVTGKQAGKLGGLLAAKTTYDRYQKCRRR